MFRKWFTSLFGTTIDFKELVKSGAIIIDVRTNGEFSSGNLKGSMNIPLDSISNRLAEIKKKQKPVITVCRSGARSRMAKGILERNGVVAYNGGAWNMLERKIQDTSKNR